MLFYKRELATLVLVLLLATAVLALASSDESQTRTHKAIRAFDRTKTSQLTEATMSTANEDQVVDEEDEEQDHYDEEDDGEDETGSTDGPTTPAAGNYVATTPKIVKSTKVLSRYEQGLEDYEEAAQRVEQEQLQEQKVARQQQLSSLAKPFMTLFSVLGNALSSGRSMQVATGPDPSWLFRGLLAGTGRKGDDGQDFITKVDGKSTSTDDDDDDADNQNANSTALLLPAAAAKEEGRYIKGDPLNGYYDFVISEGSYKFWAAFQVATAVLIIYSTFAAIYYSKVSPLTSDYDYIDYLNGGRSFAGGRSTMVGPAPAASARGDHGGSSSSSSLSWQDRMLDKPWFNMAAQSFAFVMDAIERAPK